MYVSYLNLLFAAAAAGSPLTVRAGDVTATVDLATTKGTPKHLAAGFIYGIPDNYPNQIPSKWYEGFDIQYGRAGGAQLGSPDRGWIWGLQEYYGRVNSTYTNYKTCREYDADFVLLPHDIWGTDHANSSTVWPYSDWADYDKFVKQLMNDLYDLDMLDGLVWDIWNEPDISIFWAGTMQEWIDLYIRTHKLIRADSRFNNVKISGPTLAQRPLSSNTWWTSWLSQIAGNDTIPDQWAYHLEGSTDDTTNDPMYVNASLSALLKTYDIPDDRETNINEYAIYAEQVPAGYAWWIARLERYDYWGLLGNWMSTTELHDLMAEIITKESDPSDYTATDYAAAAGYWVYHYYTQNMTGERLATTGSTDTWLDVYATKDDSTVRLLVGNKLQTGTWEVQVNNLTAIGYPEAGSVTINTWGFDYSDHMTVQAAPSFRNTVTHTYTGNSMTFPIYQTDTYHAWAFEFPVQN